MSNRRQAQDAKKTKECRKKLPVTLRKCCKIIGYDNCLLGCPIIFVVLLFCLFSFIGQQQRNEVPTNTTKNEPNTRFQNPKTSTQLLCPPAPACDYGFATSTQYKSEAKNDLCQMMVNGSFDNMDTLDAMCLKPVAGRETISLLCTFRVDSQFSHLKHFEQKKIIQALNLELKEQASTAATLRARADAENSTSYREIIALRVNISKFKHREQAVRAEVRALSLKLEGQAEEIQTMHVRTDEGRLASDHEINKLRAAADMMHHMKEIEVRDLNLKLDGQATYINTLRVHSTATELASNITIRALSIEIQNKDQEFVLILDRLNISESKLISTVHELHSSQAEQKKLNIQVNEQIRQLNDATLNEVTSLEVMLVNEKSNNTTITNLLSKIHSQDGVIFRLRADSYRAYESNLTASDDIDALHAKIETLEQPVRQYHEDKNVDAKPLPMVQLAVYVAIFLTTCSLFTYAAVSGRTKARNQMKKEETGPIKKKSN